jgi:hypothetical protein
MMPDKITQPTSYQLAILNGLQSMQVYQGTGTKRNKAANKRARAQRKLNARRGK